MCQQPQTALPQLQIIALLTDNSEADIIRVKQLDGYNRLLIPLDT